MLNKYSHLLVDLSLFLTFSEIRTRARMNLKKTISFLFIASMGVFSWSCRKDVVPEGYRVALTFDDGPDGKYTPQVLDILRQEEIKATFFLIGKHIRQHPDVTQRIHAEGHCIGNHSYHHYWMPDMGFFRVMNEIVTTEFLIDSICGSSLKYFRAPWGAIHKDQEDQLKARGYTVFNWDLDSDDWDIKHNSVDGIVNKVVACAGSGKIILFHSADFAGVDGREKTVAALPRIIRILKQQHYRFVTLEELVRERKLQ
jgi:peptidoglycan/xylan/chitin deacetylase (PgdA/CDA1 family)